MIEGSGSGSRRSKNTWIRWIQIRIRNTGVLKKKRLCPKINSALLASHSPFSPFSHIIWQLTQRWGKKDGEWWSDVKNQKDWEWGGGRIFPPSSRMAITGWCITPWKLRKMFLRIGNENYSQPTASLKIDHGMFESGSVSTFYRQLTPAGRGGGKRLTLRVMLDIEGPPELFQHFCW